VMKSQKSDIVFVFPPAFGNSGMFRQHLGISYLRAALAPTGITTEQYCSERPGSVDDVARDILARHPRMVGFTVYDSNYPAALAIARCIKSQRPGVITVFGGPTATFSADELLKHTDAIDACIRGETEETGPPILQRLLDGVEMTDGTPGLAFRRGDNVVCGPLPPLVGHGSPGSGCSLDSIPSPYLSGILSNGRTGVLSGRGCTHNCQYCAFAALGRKTLRVHSIERVLAELECIAETQRRTRRRHVVAIHDDTFTLLAPRAKALCRAIIGRKLGLSLSCVTRADTLDIELLHLLREAGFVGLAFGLESAVPEVLRATGKVRPPDWPDSDLLPEREFVQKVRNSVVAAKKLGFSVGVSIILGLPTETAEQGAETLRFVRSLPVDFYMHNLLWLFPGTPLWDSHTSYGLSCTTDKFGLARTTEYAYDLTSLSPQPRCMLERESSIVRLLASDAMFSCATSPPHKTGTAVILIDGAELTPEFAAWARSVLDIGGLLVQIIPPLEDDKLIQQLDHDRLLITEEMVPARHHVHVLRKRSRSRKERFLLACPSVDLVFAHKPRMLTLSATDTPEPLRSWLQGKGSIADVCELNGYLSNPTEIRAFLRGTKQDDLLGSISRRPVPPEIKYVGRWLEGATPCRSLSRIEVDSAGCIRCCRHGEPVGRVGDSRRKLIHGISAAIRSAAKRRGCDACALDHCPRCPFPGVPDDAYCSIMKSQHQVLDFLGLLHICSTVPVLLARVQERSGED